MKIYMSPARSPPLLNKYIDVTVAGLEALGVVVDGLPFIPRAGGAAAVHLHWLELMFASGRASRHPFLYRKRSARVLSTISKVRRAGGRLVWTVHNLRPHGGLSSDADAAYSEFRKACLDELDVFVSLSESGTSEARRAYPELERIPCVVARHPHYRGIVGPSGRAGELRDRLGIPKSAFVLGCIGTILPYKGVAEAAEAFSRLRGGELRFLVVGPVGDWCRDRLQAVAAGDRRILVRDTALTDRQVADWHSVVDAAVFNGASSFNSGTLLMALSLNRPVLAPRTNVHAETAALVGDNWLSLFSHPLDSEELGVKVEKLRSQGRGKACDLSAFDPIASARSLVTAYTGGS